METILKLVIKAIKPIICVVVILLVAVFAYFRIDPFHFSVPKFGTGEKHYTQSTVIRDLKNNFGFRAGDGTATDVEVSQTYRTWTSFWGSTYKLPITNGTYVYKANFNYTAMVNAQDVYKTVHVTTANGISTVTITLPQPYLSAALNPYTSGEIQKPGNPLAPRIADESTIAQRRALTNVTNPANAQYQKAIVRGRMYLQEDLTSFLKATGANDVVINWSGQPDSQKLAGS